MNRIRDLRIAEGWTQMQLGKKIGAAKSTVSGYENGDRQLTPALIHALCDLFDCSADYLLCRSEIRNPAVSDEEIRLVEAFRAADPDLQDLIRRNLKITGPQQKKAVS